jgi:hypothetical protein
MGDHKSQIVFSSIAAGEKLVFNWDGKIERAFNTPHSIEDFI